RLRATTAYYDREKTAAAIGRAIGYWVDYEDQENLDAKARFKGVGKK
ncbi:MAG TPA: hypothetical protein HPP58_07040, partial [Deltaproteobacteria bacterium]|nr:hypothetical protein [Deltaproteobacteria bacterium]